MVFPGQCQQRATCVADKAEDILCDLVAYKTLNSSLLASYMSLISSMQQSMNLGILASPLTCFVLLVSIANLTLSLVNVNEQVPTAPYLTFEGRLIPNNSQVQISRIGSDVSSGVQCHTDLTACCNGSFGGQWSIFGTLGGSQNASQNTGFGQGLISLHSITGFQSGIYQCDIDTVASIASGGPREILLVGVYQGSK